MRESGRGRWVGAMVLVAGTYLVIGVGTAALDKWAGGGGGHPWRVAAWVGSAVVAAGHLGYEHYRRGSSAWRTAARVAGGVALGAFGVAVAANVHWLLAGEARGPRAPVLAMPVWPVAAGVAAFLVAFVVATVLGWVSRRG